MKIGVISDTHGLLRREAIEELKGSDLIIHAGDIGDVGILDALKKLAPVMAVRGNNDKEPRARGLPAVEVLQAESTLIYVLHDLSELDFDPVAAGIQVVVSGHTHRPSLETKLGVLFLNPGSAGPRRFTLPVTLARLSIEGALASGELLHLDCEAD
jgi:uncharacterized protein